jgi:hypothetical protein
VGLGATEREIGIPTSQNMTDSLNMRLLKSKKHWRLGFVVVATSLVAGEISHAQKTVRKPERVPPPKFQPNDFAGVFFPDAVAQLQGKVPQADAMASNGPSGLSVSAESNEMEPTAKGNDVWKQLIAGQTIEDLIKEAKARVDGVITTPAKFAGGGYSEARREFTLLASMMAIIAQYPEEIRWKSSAPYARTVFARMAANCKVGTQQVFNEAKLRQQDLQDLLKGSKLTGTAEETSWADTADRGPAMQLLEWSLRENLAPNTNSEDSFNNNMEEVVKYAELIAAYGQILQLEGMTDADDETYVQYATAMGAAAKDVLKAVKSKDAELARTAVGRIDQSCNKCHESYR